MSIQHALISLSDKTNALFFAKGLAEQNVRLISTGGTAKLLQEAGLSVIEIAEHTGHPEMLDGRVKTLHPKVHGGILARRDLPEHMQTLREYGITAIDLVCVNLYPFEATIAKGEVSLEEAIENIDIGGPAMLRSAAKNYASVAVVTDPQDYESVLLEMKANGGALLPKTRFALAKKAFTHTARYDAAIANFLTSLDEEGNMETRALFPEKFHFACNLQEVLRYGENPHQQAAFYRDLSPVAGSIATYTQIQGKELSYNNIADADAALECVKAFAKPACVIVKHANPCGVAIASDLKTAYEKAFLTDPTSAFGGILAVNGVFDEGIAQAMSDRQHFVEVIIAPAYTEEAKTILAKKPNIRVLELPFSAADQYHAFAMKRVGGGLLLQSPDDQTLVLEQLKTASKRAPTPEEYDDLLFAWTVAKFVKSNAIVFCKDGMTLGVGAGQMSRVDATRIASIKAHNAGLSLKGAVVSSDAFFPFRDGLDVIAETGASAIIQPGGSMRDEEVIAAANEHNMAMLLTSMRHFRH